MVEAFGCMAEDHLKVAFVFDNSTGIAFGPARFEQGEKQAFGALLCALQGQIFEMVCAHVPGLVPGGGKRWVSAAPVVRRTAADTGGARGGSDAFASAEGAKEPSFRLWRLAAVAALT
jgi:hypothetical protein